MLILVYAVAMVSGFGATLLAMRKQSAPNGGPTAPVGPPPSEAVLPAKGSVGLDKQFNDALQMNAFLGLFGGIPGAILAGSYADQVKELQRMQAEKEAQWKAAAEKTTAELLAQGFAQGPPSSIAQGDTPPPNPIYGTSTAPPSSILQGGTQYTAPTLVAGKQPIDPITGQPIPLYLPGYAPTPKPVDPESSLKGITVDYAL